MAYKGEMFGIGFFLFFVGGLLAISGLTTAGFGAGTVQYVWVAAVAGLLSLIGAVLMIKADRMR